MTPSAAVPPRYQAFYCEENVWQLCHHPSTAGGWRRVVVTSNRRRQTLLLAQRAAPPGEPIIFDYHVFLIRRATKAAPLEVHDLDSRIGCPVPFARYKKEGLPPIPDPHPLAPWFRLIDADEYVARFSSDRSHMLDSSNEWTYPPPDWPPILNGASTLDALIDLDDTTFGEMIPISEFVRLG